MQLLSGVPRTWLVIFLVLIATQAGLVIGYQWGDIGGPLSRRLYAAAMLGEIVLILVACFGRGFAGVTFSDPD